MKNEKNEIDELEPPTLSYDDDGTPKLSLAAALLLYKKEGYTFMTMEEVKKLGVEFVVCYYMKQSESFEPGKAHIASEERRVYKINYIRNRKNGHLMQVSKPIKLSVPESQKQFDDYAVLANEKIAGTFSG